MFGGDEVSSLVFDLGTFQFRIGYSGEDSPKCAIRPLIGIFDNQDKKSYFYNELGLRYTKPGTIINTIMSPDGSIKNYDLFEKFIENLITDELSVDLKEHPLIFSEPSLHNKAYRQKLTEFMFEKFNIPAIYICKSSVLSAFSCGRSTCLVFDSGDSNTYAVPVNEGYALQKCLLKSSVAGNFITEIVMEKLKKGNVKVTPFYSIKKTKKPNSEEYEYSNIQIEGIDPSYENFWKKDIVRDLKESCLLASDDDIKYNYDKDEFEQSSMAQKATYDLPDGNTIELQEDRMFLLERVFNKMNVDVLKENNNSLNINNDLFAFTGYHNLVIDAINKCDIEIKKDLFMNIFLCGGNTLFQGFPERMQKQIFKTIKQNVKLKIITNPSNTERKFSTWIGGSILSSLGTFHQLWLSRAECEENGPMIIERKCP